MALPDCSEPVSLEELAETGNFHPLEVPLLTASHLADEGLLEVTYNRFRYYDPQIFETAPNGAIVNVDDPPIIPTKEGPQVPHVGYQTPGKRRDGGRSRGHILLDSVPVTRPSLGDKKRGANC